MTRCGFVAGMLLLTAANLLLLPPAGSEEIGRLFSTPAERARLDGLRNGVAEKAGSPAADSGGPAAVPGPLRRPVFLNGVARRSDGTEILWVNGHRTEGHSGPDGIEIHRVSDTDFRVTIRGYDKAARLRPGQMWIPGAGLVLEGAPAPAERISSGEDAAAAELEEAGTETGDGA